VAILDANARRVVARLFAVEGDARSAAVERALWERAHSLLPPARQMSAFTQAIMDLGAGPCAARRPDCEACPVQSHCQAFAAGRTAEIPAPRVTRARATRQAQVLVVLHRGRVLLEERPASGIWGGLLAPPQFASEAALRKAASGWSTRPPESLPVRRHEFTHFVLEFTPQVVRVRSAGSPLAGARWVSLSRIEGEALPSPMFRLLRDLRP
jgi:A/G-specific adenine glycosylase